MIVSMKFHILFMRLHECKLNKCLTCSVLRIDGLKELHCHLISLSLFMCQTSLLADGSDKCGRATESHKAWFLLLQVALDSLGLILASSFGAVCLRLLPAALPAALLDAATLLRRPLDVGCRPLSRQSLVV